MSDVAVFKKTGLAKRSSATTKLAMRVEHAQQRFNERFAKAESLYAQEIREAIAELDGGNVQEETQPAGEQTQAA